MKLNEIKKLSEFMEIVEWQFDGHGLVITDWHDLTEAVMNTRSSPILTASVRVVPPICSVPLRIWRWSLTLTAVRRSRY